MTDSVAQKIGAYFDFSGRGTTLRTEVVAGATTFLTMAYIVLVNPSILGQAGMPVAAVAAATCFAAAFASVLMGVAASRVWKQTGFGLEIQVWSAQLGLNFLWSALFFWQHRIGLALADMAALWLLLLATLILFWQRDRLAGLLLVPYLAWTGYAFALNLAIWRLNGG